jgi:hypothetical protein
MSWHSSAHRPYKIAISIARGERNVFQNKSAMQGNNLLHEKIDNYCQPTIIHKKLILGQSHRRNPRGMRGWHK